jgi:hypothetical protein
MSMRKSDVNKIFNSRESFHVCGQNNTDNNFGREKKIFTIVFFLNVRNSGRSNPSVNC